MARECTACGPQSKPGYDRATLLRVAGELDVQADGLTLMGQVPTKGYVLALAARLRREAGEP